jgi:hypothetical protein
MSTCQQRPLFFSPKGGRCTQVLLFFYIFSIKNASPCDGIKNQHDLTDEPPSVDAFYRNFGPSSDATAAI